MGVLVDRTPKCHCELAGEGIECSWGCAKNHYRRVSLKRKKSKDSFRSERVPVKREGVNNSKDSSILTTSEGVHLCVLQGMVRAP